MRGLLNPSLLLATASTLVGVLAVASLAKLRDPAAARAGLRTLAPASVAAWSPAPYVLVGVEVVLAVGLLLPEPAATVAASCVVALFAAFLAALVRAVLSGTTGACACLGAWSDEPVTWLSVARTGLLLAVAATHLGLVLTTREGVAAAVGRSDAEDVAVGAGAAVLLLAVVGLTSALGAARSRAPAPGSGGPARPGAALLPANAVDRTGEPIPDVEVVLPEGRVRSLRDLAAGRALLVVVASAGCDTCREVLDELPAWQEDLGHSVRVVVVTSTDLHTMLAAHPAIEPMLTLGSGALRAVFEIPGTPAAVLLGVDGRVATRVALGADEVFGLLEGVLRRVRPPAGERAAVEVAT